jgi:rhamnosyl/mannosyltransferase
MAKGHWPADALIAAYEALFLPLLLRRTNALVAVSPMVAARHRRLGAKLQVIPPGVDLHEFTPTALPDRLSTVTYVGRIESHSRWKGIEVLIDAMVAVRKLARDAQLELVGGGDAVAHYAEQARMRGIADIVRFSGPLAGQALVDAYQRSSVVVLPSTSQAESFGISLLEAMACGRPVIGSRSGGIPWVLEHERNGLLVAPNDARALSEAIARILGNRPLAARLAEAGLEKAGRFDWDIQAEKYRRLFGALISGGHRLGAEAGARAS